MHAYYYYHAFKFLFLRLKNMLFKSPVLIFWFKTLHVLSFGSSKFEFRNMHILLGKFSRHMCDVIGVNQSMKRGGVKALVCICLINYHVRVPLQTD